MSRLALATLGPAGPTPLPAQAATPSPPTLNCNFTQLLANSPAALESYQACESALSRGQLSPRQREQIALAVAEINGSKYCLSAHYVLARKAGLSDEDILYARKATATDPQTDAILRLAQAATLQRGEISDADFMSLRRAGITDAQIAEIIANVALNIFTNYFNSVAHTEVDFPLLKPGSDRPAGPTVVAAI